MAGHKAKNKQDALLGALLVQPSIADAASAVGIGRDTAYRWMRTPQFQQRYADAKREALAETISYLQRSMWKAVVALNAILDNPDSTQTAKVAAARSLLEFGLRATELEQVVERLERLETHLSVSKGP